MHPKDALGRFGEQIAVHRLEQEGLRILGRNWRCPIGEIDIIARDGDCLVICEVKTRRKMTHGSPVSAVGPRKMRRLRELALWWLDDHSIYVPRVRFDVVGVIAPYRGQPIVTYLRGVE